MVSPRFEVATMGVLTGSRDKAGRLWSLPYRPDVEVAAADTGGISEFHDAEAGVLQRAGQFAFVVHPHVLVFDFRARIAGTEQRRQGKILQPLVEVVEPPPAAGIRRREKQDAAGRQRVMHFLDGR